MPPAIMLMYVGSCARALSGMFPQANDNGFHALSVLDWPLFILFLFVID